MEEVVFTDVILVSARSAIVLEEAFATILVVLKIVEGLFELIGVALALGFIGEDEEAFVTALERLIEFDGRGVTFLF